MKNKKLFIILGIILVAIIIVLFLFGVFGSLSLINVGGRPLETKTFSFAGFEGTAEAPIFGSATNTRGNDFCNTNDADSSISNSLSSGQTLSLSSSMSSSKRACSGNGINAEITLPVGTITGTCSVSANEGYNDISRASCSVNGFNLKTHWHYECPGKGNIDWKNENCNSPKTESFEIVLDKETKVNIGLLVSVGYSGSSSASISLNFKQPVQQTYYRFLDNKCFSVLIFDSEKTSNDYETLIECKENIIESKKIFYIQEGSECVLVELYETELKGNEFLSLQLCENSKKTFYRLEDSKCFKINLFESEKTNKDFLTFNECEIERKSGLNFFEKIWEFIVGLFK